MRTDERQRTGPPTPTASGQALTLDDLARRIDLSSRTIDRHLKRENPQFRDLSQKVRFERACQLLAGPGASVNHVAPNLGFSDAGNFSRAFRRVVGISPSEYRRAGQEIRAGQD